MSVRVSLAVLIALAPCTAPYTATAQAPGRVPAEGIKRDLLPSVLRPACAVTPVAVAPPSNAKRSQARDLVSRAQQSAILGDTSAALAHLREAEALDPTDAEVAFQLARVYEGGDDRAAAVREYCRFLSLAPNSPDGADARARVSALAKPTVDPSVESANATFGEGLAAYDARQWARAESQFSRAIEAQPAWADAYYDRAQARLATGHREDAADDLGVYLRLRPAAQDRQIVADRINALRIRRLSPAAALGLGLVLPGGGQFYAREPVLGAAILLAASGAVAYAVAPEHRSITVQQTATDPFGNPYTYSTIQDQTRRTHLTPGLIGAGAVALLGALQATSHAARLNADGDGRVSLSVTPAETRLAFRLRF